MGTRSFARSLVATTSARASLDAGFKHCCLRPGRYDGSRKNHFFPRVIARSALAVRKHFLRADGHGLSLQTKQPHVHQLVKKASSRAEIVKLITEHDLPREAISTQWLNEVAVWDALLQRMPMTAMIRNLGKMPSVGLVQPFSDAAKLIVRKLGDETVLKRARIHPLAVLIAEKVYVQGKGEKGSLTWRSEERRVGKECRSGRSGTQ